MLVISGGKFFFDSTEFSAHGGFGLAKSCLVLVERVDFGREILYDVGDSVCLLAYLLLDTNLIF